jgi:protoporphyrinogen oxidase
MSEHWGIVGGGLLGLTLAHRLAGEGRRITVLEAAPELGGLASAWRLGDVVWDRHYHVTLLSDLALRRLLRELGLEHDMRWRRTRSLFYTDGRLVPMNNAFDFLRYPSLGMFAKARLAATILSAARIEDGRPLERIGAAEWLARRSGREAYERLWRPLLRAKLGENADLASAAFIWAVIRRLYAARRSGLKTEMFGYLPGGYRRILARFQNRLAARDVEIRTSCRASRVEQQDGRFRVAIGDGEAWFDRVIVTAPAPVAAELCRDLAPEERTRLGDVVYQGIVCASLLLRRRLSDSYLTYITDETIPFTAVVEMSALVDRAEFSGKHLVYLPRYVLSGDPWLKLSDEEVRAEFLAGLRRLHPDLRDEDIAAFRVSRAPYVLPIPTLGYSDRLPPMTTSVPGLALVGSAHIVNGTLNVNETVMLADAAAERLLGEWAAAPREKVPA